MKRLAVLGIAAVALSVAVAPAGAGSIGPVLEEMTKSVNPGKKGERAFGLALMLRGPVQGKRERNEPSRAIGQASPKQAEDCPNANRDVDRLHRILRKVVTEFCRRGDEQLPAGGRSCLIDRADLILQEWAGMAQSIIGPVERL